MTDHDPANNTWYDSRYVNWTVGVLVLVCAVLGVAALVFTGQVQKWFGGDTTIRLNLPDEGAFGLQAGDPVRVQGTRAGTVTGIHVDDQPDGNRPAVLYAEVRLRDAFLPFVSDGSKAIIHKELGIAGQTYVQITRTTGTLTGDPPVLNTTANRTALALLEDAVKNVQDNVLPAIANLSDTVQSLSGQGEGTGIPGTIDRVGSIAGKIDRGQGVLGRLVNDEGLAGQIQNVARRASEMAGEAQPVVADAREIAEDVRVLAQRLRTQSQELPQLVDQLEQTLKRARSMVGGVASSTEGVPDVVDSVQAAADELPTTLIQLRTTLTEMEDVLDAIQQSWLIEGGGGQPDLLTPTEVAP